MATLIHLNGAPGVGKSTIAERYADAHPGVLNCDIDRLRCLIGGWRQDFDGVGAVVRPIALAMIREHLDGGRDVVLPQMLAREEERSRFEAAASGHGYLQVHLRAGPSVHRERFENRPDDALQRAIRGSVEQQGGVVDVIDELVRRVAVVAAGAIIVDATGSPDDTYRAVVRAVERATG